MYFTGDKHSGIHAIQFEGGMTGPTAGNKGLPGSGDSASSPHPRGTCTALGTLEYVSPTMKDMRLDFGEVRYNVSAFAEVTNELLWSFEYTAIQPYDYVN